MICGISTYFLEMNLVIFTLNMKALEEINQVLEKFNRGKGIYYLFVLSKISISYGTIRINLVYLGHKVRVKEMR